MNQISFFLFSFFAMQAKDHLTLILKDNHPPPKKNNWSRQGLVQQKTKIPLDLITPLLKPKYVWNM